MMVAAPLSSALSRLGRWLAWAAFVTVALAALGGLPVMHALAGSDGGSWGRAALYGLAAGSLLLLADPRGLRARLGLPSARRVGWALFIAAYVLTSIGARI